MEFKYRAVDQRPSGHHPHSQHAIGADFRNPSGMRYAPDMGSSLANNVEVHQMQEQGDCALRTTNNDRSLNCFPNLGVDPIHEQKSSLEVIQYDAIQRQWEKQQIREEIIASEIMRRRMLEAEVRRELEQEMALRHTACGFRSQERSPILFDQRFSFLDQVNKKLIREPWAFGGLTTVDLLSSGYPLRPIHEATQPGINSGASGSRAIFPARQASDLSGSKRKLIVTPLEQCSQGALPARNKIPKEEYSCALCQVSATDAKGLDEHLQGKKHKLMEEKLIAEKIERKKPLSSMVLEGEAADSEKGINEETDQKSRQPTLEAMKGRNETSSRKDDGLETVPNIETSIQLPFEDPKVCNDNSTRKEDGQMFVPKVEIRPKESNDKRKKSFKFWCEPCGVGAFGKTVFEAHKKGKKHRLNVGSKGEATADSVLTAAANNDNGMRKDDEPKFVQKVEIHPEGLNNKKNSFKFWCEPCGVGAFSEMVFERHKKGKKHWLNFGSKEEVTSDSAVIAAENNNNLGLPPEDMKVCNDNSTRKDDGPEIVPNAEIHPEESNNEKKNGFEFWCEPCGVGAFSESVFEEHKKGKKHWLNFGSKEEATSGSAVTAAKNKNNSGPPAEDMKVSNGSSDSMRKDDGPEIVPKVEICPEELTDKMRKSFFRFWSEPCRSGAFSETVFEEHKKGNERCLNVGSKEEATSDCDVTNAEKNSNPHPLTEDMKICNSSSKDDGPKIVPEVICPEESNNKRKRGFKFWCEPCGVGAFDDTVFEAHRKGKKHRFHVGSKERATSDIAVTAAENSNKSGPPPEAN